MTKKPARTQKVMAVPEDQAHVEPDMVRAMMRKTQTKAFRQMPSQSRLAIFWRQLSSGMGLNLGNEMNDGAMKTASGRLR